MEKKIFTTKETVNFDGYRLDKFLQSQLKKFSRTKIQRLIKSGFVKINNKIIKEASKKIKVNDEIVINKSPGMVVHPGAGNYEKTLVNALLYHCKNNLSGIGGKLRPGIVHRIDKDTSGAIVVAKNDFAHINLSEQFSKHTIKRTYEAIVWGSLRPSIGKINENISRSIRNRQLMSVSKNKGKKAITNYKTLKVFKNLNLPKMSHIECKLETGRTHQIRVHMSFKGNPIIGDKSYGKTQKKFKNIDASIEKKINNFNRQALHAKSLGFIHPKTNKEIFLEAIRPKDFDMLIENLNKVSI